MNSIGYVSNTITAELVGSVGSLLAYHCHDSSTGQEWIALYSQVKGEIRDTVTVEQYRQYTENERTGQ